MSHRITIGLSVALVAAMLVLAGCVEVPSGPGPSPAGGFEAASFDAETAVLQQSAQGYEALADRLDRGDINSAQVLLDEIGKSDRAARDACYLDRDKAFTEVQYDAADTWHPEQAAAALRELAAGKRRRAGQ